MRARAPLLLVALACTSCASTLWYGHSLDRRHRAEVVARGGRHRVVHDGREGPAFEAIGVEAIAFGAGGRLAYPARRGARWVVVRDGVEGASWDAIGELRFSPDGHHLAHAVLDGARWRVVLDGRPGAVHAEALLAGSLTFSVDGRRLAYAIAEGALRRVVVDGRPGRAYLGVGKLAFDRDRLRYLARSVHGAHLVVEDHEGPAFAAISEVVSAPNGRLGYLARDGARWRAVIDGEPADAHDELAALRFSDDGRHVAYAARDGRRARVVLDGRPGPLHDGVRFATLAFTRRGALLYVARERGRYRVVHDGVPGPLYDAVEPPAVGPHGDRWGYLARRGRLHELVVDGTVVGRYPWAADLAFGAAGTPHLVVARGRRRAVVHRGHEHVLDLVVEGTLTLSRDGEHWACLAGDRRRRKLFIAVDGIWTRPFDLRELVGELAHRRGAATRADLLAHWIAAELERTCCAAE